MAYVVAKHALRGLTLALAGEYASKGVRIFSVSPSFMATSLTDRWDARLVESIRASAPMSHPVDAAQRIRELVEDLTVPGQGRITRSEAQRKGTSLNL